MPKFIVSKRSLSSTPSPLNEITSPFDREQLHVNQQRIKDKFWAVTNWMAETIVDLEANNENERIHKFEALAKDLQRRVNENQRAVKEKMEKILYQV